MGRSIAYSSAQVTKALMALVANQGNAKKTSEELIDDDFQVPVATLRAWKNEVHAEQYRRLEERYGKELEQEAVEQARMNLRLAGEKKRELLNKVDPEKTPLDTLPAMLKAVTDAEAKSTTGLLQLTGRPTNPTGDHSTEKVIELLEKMKEVGYVAFAPGLPMPPKRVPNQAE